MHANKQLVNIENWSLNECVINIFTLQYFSVTWLIIWSDCQKLKVH